MARFVFTICTLMFLATAAHAENGDAFGSQDLLVSGDKYTIFSTQDLVYSIVWRVNNTTGELVACWVNKPKSSSERSVNVDCQVALEADE